MAQSSGKIKETPLQIGIVQLLRLDFLPEDLIFTATANGANLQKKQKRTGEWYCPEGKKLKSMGVLAGVSDLIFWWPVAVEEDGKVSLWMDTGLIEIKTADGTLELEQIEFRRRVKAMGGKYSVARKYETVRDTLIAWGVKCQHRVRFT